MDRISMDESVGSKNATMMSVGETIEMECKAKCMGSWQKTEKECVPNAHKSSRVWE